MDVVTLKAYFRDLVIACGGTKRAAAKVHAQASHLSEAMGAHNEDRWPRLDHIALLEADCQQPILTRALADRLGYALVPLDAEGPRRATLDHLGAIIKECGEVELDLARASSDGRLTRAERKKLLDQANEAIAALTALRLDLLKGEA